MQQITQDYLANKAKELLNSGICSRVFGWKRGEFDYDLTPAVFTTGNLFTTAFAPQTSQNTLLTKRAGTPAKLRFF